MKNLYESILGDIDTTLNKSDETIEEMKKIHWLYSKSTDKVFKNIKGGIGMIFKKHFPKKLPRINVRWAYDPISVRPDDDHLFAYMTPNIEYLKALILNTKLPKPITGYNFFWPENVKIMEACINESLNKYMTDEWKDFRTKQNNWPVLTANCWVQQSGMKISIYYHQNDIKYESQALCDILLKGKK